MEFSVYERVLLRDKKINKIWKDVGCINGIFRVWKGAFEDKKINNFRGKCIPLFLLTLLFVLTHFEMYITLYIGGGEGEGGLSKHMVIFNSLLSEK